MYDPREINRALITTMKFRTVTFDKLLVRNNNPGPGAYEISSNNSFIHRRKPAPIYKLPDVNSTKKIQNENQMGQIFYENKLALNGTGKYPLSRVPNVNTPHIHKNNSVYKPNS